MVIAAIYTECPCTGQTGMMAVLPYKNKTHRRVFSSLFHTALHHGSRLYGQRDGTGC